MPKAQTQMRVLVADYAEVDAAVDVPYLLHQAGARVDILCTRRAWLRAGSYYERWIPLVEKTEDSFYALLCASVDQGVYDRIILADDFALRIVRTRAIGAHYESALLPLVHVDMRALLGSKAALSRLATRVSLPTPEYAICEGGLLPEVLPTFPVLLKCDESEAGWGVWRANTQEELVRQFEKLAPHLRIDAVIQSYIAGDNIAVEALYSQGVLLQNAVSRVVTTFPNEFGTSIARVYGEEHAIRPLLARLGEAFGIDGFCNITCIRSRATGEYFLVEVDIRPQGWFQLAIHAGIDFVPALRQYLARKPNPKLLGLTQPYHRTLFHFFRDVHDAYNRNDIREFLRCLGGIDGRWRSLPWHDPKLFALTLWRGLRFWIKSV